MFVSFEFSPSIGKWQNASKGFLLIGFISVALNRLFVLAQRQGSMFIRRWWLFIPSFVYQLAMLFVSVNRLNTKYITRN